MIGKLMFAGLIGAAAVGAARVLRSNEGEIGGGASRAADAVRQQGPGLVENVAQGIEKVGDATEKGAKTIREMAANEGSDGGSMSRPASSEMDASPEGA